MIELRDQTARSRGAAGARLTTVCLARIAGDQRSQVMLA